MLGADKTITLVQIRGAERYTHKLTGTWTHDLAVTTDRSNKMHVPAAMHRVRIPLTEETPEIMIGDILILGDVDTTGMTLGQLASCKPDAFKAMSISYNRSLSGYGDHIRVYGDG